MCKYFFYSLFPGFHHTAEANTYTALRCNCTAILTLTMPPLQPQVEVELPRLPNMPSGVKQWSLSSSLSLLRLQEADVSRRQSIRVAVGGRVYY